MSEIDIKGAKCIKCGITPQPGVMITRWYNNWVCGKCLTEHYDKLQQKNVSALMEE